MPNKKLPPELLLEISKYLTLTEFIQYIETENITNKRMIRYVLQESNHTIDSYEELRYLINHEYVDNFENFSFNEDHVFDEENILYQAIIHNDQRAVEAILEFSNLYENIRIPHSRGDHENILIIFVNERSPIELAMLENNFNITELLLSTNNIIVTDDLLMNMVYNNVSLDIIALFINSTEVDLNICLNDTTALINAVENNSYEMVELLLTNGADPNIQTEGRRSLRITALIVAVQNNMEDIVELLLNYDANRDIENRRGKIAMDYAIENNNLRIIQLLE
jgi:hypothetical protein